MSTNDKTPEIPTEEVIKMPPSDQSFLEKGMLHDLPLRWTWCGTT